MRAQTYSHGQTKCLLRFFSSLRFRLMLWYLLILGIVLCVFSTAIYVLFEHTLYQSLNALLTTTMVPVASSYDPQTGQVVKTNAECPGDPAKSPGTVHPGQSHGAADGLHFEPLSPDRLGKQSAVGQSRKFVSFHLSRRPDTSFYEQRGDVSLSSWISVEALPMPVRRVYDHHRAESPPAFCTLVFPAAISRSNYNNSDHAGSWQRLLFCCSPVEEGTGWPPGPRVRFKPSRVPRKRSTPLICTVA